MPVVNGITITFADRVQETTQTSGTGTYTLDGAPSGKRTFVAGIGNGNNTIYTASLGASWEVGIGLVASGAPSTLSRLQILASSNSNNAVSWGAGTKDVFCDISAALANQIWIRPGGSLPIGIVEMRGPLTPSGSQSVIEFTGIANTARVIHVGFSNLTRTDGSPLLIQLGDAGGYENTGYVTQTHWGTTAGRGLEGASSAWVIAATGASGTVHFGSVTMTCIGTNPGFWTYSGACYTGGSQSYTDHSAGAKALSSVFDRFRLTNGAAVNFSAGGTVSAQIIHAV
jgi:hypothetical protein